MDQGTIFISYRRDDTSGFTRAVQDQLVKRFSRDRVFMDVDAIEPGLPFDKVIDEAVGRCQVVLVMIGRHWLDAQPGGEPPRLHDPDDYVRIEILAALSRDIRVIPVLVDGAAMPPESALPEPLRPLARRNAIEISNTRFEADVNRLADSIAKVVGSPAQRGVPRGPLGITAAVVLLGGLAAAGGYLVAARDATCSWNLSGTWVIAQSNGPNVRVTVRQDGKALTGTAASDAAGAGGPVPLRNGTIDANRFGFEVPWRTGGADASIGRYEGEIDASGNLSGTGFDQINPAVRATWKGDHPAPCL